jgi:hypothetical protein
LLIAARLLCCVHSADHLQGLVIPLSPPTQHHHWTIGVPGQLHLLERDARPRLATRSQGIQTQGLAVPRRHGARGWAARRAPARLMERLLQRCPLARPVAQPPLGGPRGGPLALGPPEPSGAPRDKVPGDRAARATPTAGHDRSRPRGASAPCRCSPRPSHPAPPRVSLRLKAPRRAPHTVQSTPPPRYARGRASGQSV